MNISILVKNSAMKLNFENLPQFIIKTVYVKINIITRNGP